MGRKFGFDGVVSILTDIAVNGTVFLTIGGKALFSLVNQTMFAVFLLATVRALWCWFRSA